MARRDPGIFRPPLSGALLGVAVKALDLRNIPEASKANQALRTKTATAYFKGKRVKDESRYTIIRGFAEALVGANFFPSSIPGSGVLSASELLSRILLHHADQWDSIAGDLAAYTPSLKFPRLAAYPYLRLAAIDFALRLASLLWLTKAPVREQPDIPIWARENGRNLLLHELIARCRTRMTRDRLEDLLYSAARRGLYTRKTVDRWLATHNATRPAPYHIEVLARIFANEVPDESEETLKRTLRLHYGLCDLGDRVAHFISRGAVQGLAVALLRYGYAALDFLKHCSTPETQMAEIQMESLTSGTAFTSNLFILRHLWRNESHPLWKTDLAAAMGGITAWKPYLEHCVRSLPAVEVRVQESRQTHGNQDLDFLVESALVSTWSNMEYMPEEARNAVAELRGQDPRYAAAELEIAGAQAARAEQYERAAELFRQATLKDPTNVSMHYNRSVALTYLHRWREALDSAHLAHALDPTLDLPAAQVGIILMDTGRPKEALEHLESAAGKLQQMTAHYAYHRALARFSLELWKPALAGCEEALGLDANFPDALQLSAECFLKLGDKLKAREYAKRAHHLGRSEVWKQISNET